MEKNWKCMVEEVLRSASRGNNFTPTRQSLRTLLSLCEMCAMLQKTNKQKKNSRVQTFVWCVFVCMCLCCCHSTEAKQKAGSSTLKKTAAVSPVTFFLRLLRARQPFCEASLAATFGGSLSAPNLLVSPRVDGGVGDTTVRGRETRGGGCLGNAARL